MTLGEDQEAHSPHDPVHLVPLDALSAAEGPRRCGEDPDHVRLLLEAGTDLPPILVHRSTMQVIDGMHRLRVAALRGRTHIAVRYYDGGSADAFVLAVRHNIRHGLPLSLTDRTAAATRITRTHPHWSDRAIARASGLSPKTVAAIRRRSSGEIPLSNTRIGQDGRTRPLDATEGRRRAGDLIAAHPTMPLRQVAAKAGISLGTAHDVRERLRTGRSPAPTRAGTGAPPDGHIPRALAPAPRSPLAPPPASPPAPAQPPTLVPAPRVATAPSAQPRTPAAVLHLLRKDPSLRLTDSGRALLRLFDAQAQLVPQWDRLIDAFPHHCADMIVDLADTYAAYWQHIATHLRTATAEPETDQRIPS
jgi:ParB-like chromosome segregation protein Spo0J